MHSLTKSIVVWSLLLCFAGVLAAPALAAEKNEPIKDVSGEAMAVDFLLLRPLGMATTVLGTALCIFSVPFSSPGGNESKAIEKLMKEPARFTFQRQLGDI